MADFETITTEVWTCSGCKFVALFDETGSAPTDLACPFCAGTIANAGAKVILQQVPGTITINTDVSEAT